MLIPNHACAQPQPAARNGREAVKSMGGADTMAETTTLIGIR